MKRDLKDYLSLKYPILLTEGEDNGEPYIEAEIPELPGCGAYGKNRREALNRLEEAKKGWISARLKRGLSIPDPVSEEDFSGKFLLRITPDLHRKLAAGAKRNNKSLNQYVRNVLEESTSLGTILEKLNGLEQKLNRIDKALENPEFISVLEAGAANLYGMIVEDSGFFRTTAATLLSNRLGASRGTVFLSPSINRPTA